MPNRLANETSPYLLQHADNPVDWYPWGEAAFAEARASDRPILLSVGYSSCHWCHVMAHESFEDESIADLMNRFFVNVKVDREERPDVDSVYMGAVQAMTGQGGWPMTVFITPNGEPFYAGTYFPRDDAFGRPGFGRVLLALHEAWTQQRDNLMQTANEVVDHLRKAAAIRGDGPLSPDDAVAESAVDRLIASFDREWGGFGDAPKFPAPSTLEFLLAHHVRTADPTRGIPDMVNLTLRRMWSGGMYDHLGGGFSRYSVDRQWVVPHFEKMLYDNAQLARVYLHAYQLFGEKLHLEVARETLDYLFREMLDREGGFYSAQDADSEGIEGKYFVWTVAELRDLLGDDAEAAITEFGLTEEGNFHDPHHPELTGRNVLTRRSRKPLRAEQYGAIRKRLFEARSKRIPPGLDDKVLASWNGLALAAFADAARVLDDERYVEAARRNAAFVREKMWRDGRLLHSYKDGEARVAGLLDDYALYGLGLIELYKATGELAHLEWAKAMFEVLEEHFRDENGGYFEAPDDGEELLVRQKPLFDASVPSGNGAAAQLAWQIGRYFDRRDWERRALEILGMVERGLREVPSGFGSVLQVVELALAERRELVTVGPLDARKPLDAAAARIFAPHLLVAPTERAEGLPHFDGRGPGERALAYVCTNMVCKLPVDDPHALAKQLEAGS